MTSKYGNKKTDVDGVTFHSRAEARRYLELKLMVAAGVIANLELQPRFSLTVNGVKIGTYFGDFAYVDTETGERTIEDVKGMKTLVYNMKRKLMFACHGISIREVQA